MTSERCTLCANRRFIRCSGCWGKGERIQLPSEILVACTECEGLAAISCPLCGGIGKEVGDLRATILRNITTLKFIQLKERVLLAKLLDSLFSDDSILLAIQAAQRDCLRKRLNRHDLWHALVVTSFALDLFERLSMRTDEPQGGFRSTLELIKGGSKTIALATVLVAAFVHDLGRGFDEHARMGAIRILIGDTCRRYLAMVTDSTSVQLEALEMVARCVDNHSGKSKLVSLEESIVTLADGLDCNQFRVQPAFTVDLVMKEDPSPIEYFSCLDVECTKIEAGCSSMVDISFHIRGLVAMKQVKDFLSRLSNTELAKPHNRNKIRVLVLFKHYADAGWDSETLCLWPEVKFLPAL